MTRPDRFCPKFYDKDSFWTKIYRQVNAFIENLSGLRAQMRIAGASKFTLTKQALLLQMFIIPVILLPHRNHANLQGGISIWGGDRNTEWMSAMSTLILARQGSQQSKVKRRLWWQGGIQWSHHFQCFSGSMRVGCPTCKKHALLGRPLGYGVIGI